MYAYRTKARANSHWLAIYTHTITCILLVSGLIHTCNTSGERFSHVPVSDFSGYIVNNKHICAFVCFGIWSHSRIFLSFRDINITGEGLQILTYTRYRWPLGSEGSVWCNTYYDTGKPFIMVISEDP